MSAKKRKPSPPAMAALRLEAIFHPKFDNEAPDAEIRRKMLSKVAAGEGYVEASLKHSGSLVLWSGGRRYYSKNAAGNVFTRVGEIMLMKHFARCYGGRWREEYEKCSHLLEEGRLTCSFEVVTSVLGHHGAIPNRDYLVLIAVADRSTGGTFYSTNELVQLAHQFRLPHNDAWTFASGTACEALFRSYDEMWETGTASAVIHRLDGIVAENKGECAKVSSLYPHDIFQGEILEGLVIRYVPYRCPYASAGKEVVPSAKQRSLQELWELAGASNILFRAVHPPKEMSLDDEPPGPAVTIDLRAQAERLDDAAENALKAHWQGSRIRNVRRWDSRADDSGEASAPACISVSNIANEILSSSSTYYDRETLDIARLIQTLDLLKVHVSYKLLIEEGEGEGSDSRYLCILHVHHDASFPKYNAFLKREGLNGMPLFRGFSIELVPEMEDVGDGVQLADAFAETTTAGTEQQPNNEEKLMLKMKFLPYMVRTFICRNGLSTLQSSGAAAFEHHAIAQLTKWKASDASVSKWMPFFQGWARYCSSPSGALPPLTERTYLHHYGEFEKLYAEEKFRSSPAGEASFHGLIVVVGPFRDNLENLASALSKKLHCSRIVHDQNKVTDKDILLSMQPSGGGLICVAEIEDGYKTLRRLAKEYHEVMHVIMVQGVLDEIAGADTKRLQKLKGMSMGWKKLQCNLMLELPKEAAAQADVDATLEYLQNSPPAKAAVQQLYQFSKSKQPDERPGLIVYFPSIPGSGKSSLCQGITVDALGMRGDRQLIVLEGDQVRSQSKGKFYSVVEKEILTKPASVAILDKNVPPASFSTIHNMSMESNWHCVGIGNAITSSHNLMDIACMHPTTMMGASTDEALAQWSALVEREETGAYKVHGHTALAFPAAWREKICEWCFQVVDHCEIDRDIVSIALSYFDRYLSCHASIPETLFQLVAMTSLYLAVKLQSTRKISAISMSSLSKGHFRPDQILRMEICLIKSLRWRLTPPTPSMYLNVARPLISACVTDANDVNKIEDLSRYLLELSVCDGFFMDKSPSSIVYAAVLVALETIPKSSEIKEKLGRYQLNKSPATTELCARRIRHVYSLVEPEEEERALSSPTSVFHG